ncbi:MAG: hypothetical protein C4524_01340 [Candidatus Zixiibacteriota bacterium]|nr:MAG: hypothetical protein C4524_01340 [candidate division Zixibacteria bacterium]
MVDLDVGKRDLQQCADAIIRLRAEYLYSQRRGGEICFDFTSGHEASFARWADGYRAAVRGGQVAWNRTAPPDSSYAAFRDYLEVVFTYAGTHSLSRELAPREAEEMQIGDLLIQGGFPGHAVLVVDIAQNPETGEKVFLLAQSFMPAQDFHILKNLGSLMSPWYPLDFGPYLLTPEWKFSRSDLKCFPEAPGHAAP